jgi:methionyl-tRNA formyltransferase
LALRLLFMGTPDFAVPTLLEIIGSRHEIVAVYTRAPKPAGRGMASQPSPVGREAERFALPVFTPKTFKAAPDPLFLPREHGQPAMRAHGADVAVVVAYGLILPKAVLAAFPLGAFNLHASLLPRWRGAAPIHRAVMAGDTETGVMVTKMDEGLDTGPVAMAERVQIGPDATTGDVHDELKRRGANLMVRALAALEKGALQLTPQSASGVTYADKIDKDETRIDWTKPWKEVHDHCRGLSPFPGARSELPSVGRVKILRTTKGIGEGPPGRVLDDRLTVACGAGSVRLVELQRAGRQPMAADAFLRGMPVARASVLS